MAATMDTDTSAAATMITNSIANQTEMANRHVKKYFAFILNILPVEEKHIEFTGKVKAFLYNNFEWISTLPECISGDSAIKIAKPKYRDNIHSPKLLEIADIFYVDTLDYTDPDNGYKFKIHTIFYRLKAEELLTSQLIKEDNKIATLLYRDFLICNNVSDNDVLKYWNMYEQDNLIKELAADRIMDISFQQPDFCKTPLYLHQQDMIA